MAGAAAGSDILALERRAATLVIQTQAQFKSQRVVMLCKFLAAMTIFFPDVKVLMDFQTTCYRPTQHPSLGPIFRSLVCPWVKIRFQNRITSSK